MCAAAILVLDSLPGSAVPRAPSGVDKIAHLGMYGALGLTAGRAVLTSAGAAAVPLAVTVAAVSAFGAVDEWHQQFVPNRSMDARDWIFDTIGGAAGVAVAVFLRRRRALAAGAPRSTRTDQLS